MQINRVKQQTNFGRVLAKMSKPRRWMDITNPATRFPVSPDEVSGAFNQTGVKGLHLISTYCFTRIGDDMRKRSSLLRLPMVLTGKHAQGYEAAEAKRNTIEYLNGLLKFETGVQLVSLDVGTLCKQDIT